VSDSDQQYTVRSTDVHGEETVSTESTDSVEGLISRLKADGIQASSVTGGQARRIFEPRRVNLDEFAFFNAELAAACKQGAALPGALRALSRDMSGRPAREAIEQVALDVEGGRDFADALAEQDDIFPLAYVAMVRAGLAAGDLSGTLLVFADEARFSAKVKRTLISAVVYPALIILVSLTFLSVWAWVVVPSFAHMYQDMGMATRLPSLTGLHFRIAQLLRYGPLIFAATIILAVAVWRAAAQAKGNRPWLAKLLLMAPLFGRYLRSMAMVRFTRTTASALESGVPVPEAIVLGGLATGNAHVAQVAHAASESVREGNQISAGLAGSVWAFPSTVIWMLHVGEQRGDAAAALRECARLEETRAERLGTLLPVVVSALTTALAGGVLLEGALAMLLPLIEVTQSLGG
jgi:type II secretory pathway component PulF